MIDINFKCSKIARLLLFSNGKLETAYKTCHIHLQTMERSSQMRLRVLNAVCQKTPKMWRRF